MPDSPRPDAAMEAATNANVVHHYYCEDTWYSCPETEEGCADDSQAGCNCLYAERMGRLAGALRAFAEEQNRELRRALFDIAHGECGNEISLDQSPDDFRYAMWVWSQERARRTLAVGEGREKDAS